MAYKDIFGLPLHVGDSVEFINNESFRNNGCTSYFLNKTWKIDYFGMDTLYVVDGHEPGSSYNYYFPIDCVQLVCDYEDIDSSNICDVSSLFGES